MKQDGFLSEKRSFLRKKNVFTCVHACVREKRHLTAVYTEVDYSIRHTGEEELGGLTLQILANTNTGNWF